MDLFKAEVVVAAAKIGEINKKDPTIVKIIEKDIFLKEGGFFFIIYLFIICFTSF